jgi:drug/metabolite transporter (DMT)-like permease
MNESRNFLTKTWVVCVCAIFCCVLWGSAFPCVKIGYKLFSVDTTHVPSVLLFAGMRFFLAGILVLLFAGISQKRFPLPQKQNIWRIGVLCIFQTVGQYVFFYLGLANTSGVKSSVLNGLGVFFTILAACFLFRTEKFNLVKLLGCVLGFSGVVLINLGGDFSFSFSLMGEGFIIFSGLSSAIAAGLVKVFAKYENTAVLCGWQFLTGGTVLIVVGLCFGGSVAPTGVGSYFMLFYLAIISSVAFTLQGYLLRYNPVSKVAVFKSTNPLFGAVFSAIILGESQQLLSWFTLLALVLVCAGILIINKFGASGFKKRENQQNSV